MAEVMPSDELVDEPSDYGAMQPGTKLGRYELLVPIARGGMARVWAARQHGQRGFQKLVAIKTILPHLADEPEFERMFLDEARIASGVHHPNVCEIYELGEEKKTLYLVMEWVSGDSLARLLRSGGKTEALDARVVSRIVADACAGLHAAHELTDETGRALDVVHRDLSPHNILLTADGTAKVCDFGVAKALGQLHEATSAGQLKGKIAYMAPEQVIGSGVDRRSDVFSLGCVLYEATTGQRPFRGDGDHQVMHAVLKGELAPPTSIIRGYPQELERIVLRALSPQPILRYPTAERMRFALEEFVARGHLVTQANVAQLMRTRIGEQIERRKERIRQASTVGDREAGWSEPPGAMTPSNQAHDQRSGVKQSAAGAAARPLYTTMAMDRPDGALAIPSSSTIPQAPIFGEPAQQSHTPVSHPGAAYSRPGPGHASSSGISGQGGASPLAFAQTAQMPPKIEMPPGLEIPGPGSHPHTTQMQAISVGPSSSAPLGMQQTMQQAMQQPMQQAMQQQTQQQMGYPQGASSQSFSPGLMSPTPPPVIPFEGRHGPPSESRPSAPPGNVGHYAAAIGVGVLLAVLIGGGCFWAWRGRQVPTAVRAPAPAISIAAGAPPTPQATSTSTPTPTTTPAASPDILFRLVPADATLSVDGRDLASDARTLPRPEIGKTVTVVARAKGHEDTTVLIDFFTTSPLDLALKPGGGSVAAATAAAPDSPPTASAVAETKDPPKDPAKDPPRKRLPAKADPSLPPNPF